MTVNISSLKRELVEFREQLPRGAVNSISCELGIGQSTVSRVLNGQFSVANSNVRKICKYAGISVESNKKAGSFRNITEQLIELWDGSAEMESALLELLKGLKHLRKVA